MINIFDLGLPRAIQQVRLYDSIFMLITVKVSGRDQTQAINITIESSLSELFCDTILTETVAADGLFANQCENYLVDCEMWWLI